MRKKALLTEDIYNSPQNRRAIKYAIKQGVSKEQAKHYVDGIMNDFEIHHSHSPKFKFMLGLMRLLLSGEINRNSLSQIQGLKTALHYIASDGHINEYDENLNGESATELIGCFQKNAHEDAEASRNAVNSKQYQNQGYNIIRIDSQEQCEQYGKYTSWCITHGSFHEYKLDDNNQCYFCLKEGFENVPEVVGENSPLDEYGLSMISVIVDEGGSPIYVTTRWNHKHHGENHPQLHTAEQVSEIVGVNFYNTFKNNKWQALIDDIKQRLAQGESPTTVFDWYGGFGGGFAKVEVRNKYNFVDPSNTLISDIWFDYCNTFYNGYATVQIDEKWNLINGEGKLVSKQWYDDCCSFREGYAKVDQKEKSNFIDTQGNLISSQWFDDASGFQNGYAIVELGGKYNFIDTKGNRLSNQWFDGCGKFRRSGFADVLINGVYHFINTQGQLLDKDYQPIQESLSSDKYQMLNESVIRKIIRENILKLVQDKC